MPDMAPHKFEVPLRVRFSHCDPAGIVFFPQYMVMFNGLLEDWFTDALGVPYGPLIQQRRIGTPTVSLQCDFTAISRIGDGVTLYRTLAPNRSNMEVCIDSHCQTVNNYGANVIWNNPVSFTNLGNTLHNLTLRNLSTNYMDLNAVRVLSPLQRRSSASLGGLRNALEPARRRKRATQGPAARTRPAAETAGAARRARYYGRS